MPSFSKDHPEGQDAICFMAGPQGAHFAAGVIHAYLAADRKPPVVVAGISIGALSSAAFYESYRELHKYDQRPPGSQVDPRTRESLRWSFFRSYVEKITYEPLAPIWNAIPNPVDFFAETLPVEDKSCPADLKEEETRAREQYLRLVRLGNWLAGLRITVSDVAGAIVSRVRNKERYAMPRLQWWSMAGRSLWMSWLLATHLAVDPRIAYFHPRYSAEGKKVRNVFRVEPLFGRKVWLVSLLWAGSWLSIAPLLWFGLFVPAIFFALFAAFFPLLALFAIARSQRIAAVFLRPLGIEKGLLHKFHLRRWLREIFRDSEVELPKDGAPCHLLIVAAALNQIDGLVSGQLWARPEGYDPASHVETQRERVWLRDAVAAALSVPGIHEPEYPNPHHWLGLDFVEKLEERKQPLMLVDGAVIGSNPLPAFFTWIDRKWSRKSYVGITRLLTTDQQPSASLRVVYSVPIEALSRETAVSRESMNIVENGFASLALARRRDTEMESRQTEFISQLEYEIRRANPPRLDPDLVRYPIFPLPISPQRELVYKNSLNPSREECLEQIAHGCRRTIESNYRHQLRELFPDETEISCHRLLKVIAPRREALISDQTPGMPEVCRVCLRHDPNRKEPAVRMLSVRDVESSAMERNTPSYGFPPPRNLHKRFPNLTGIGHNANRIVLVANGGVFRGSFHIGMAAAMRLADVRPDLVVGSSVGAVIGAAVSALTAIEHDDDANRYLADLAKAFLFCDQKVALTRSLKNTAKQLGIRGRSLRVSPMEIRAMIRQGSKKDPSYAIAGAPPLLIDALADFFLLPHQMTREMAASFVSGHITEAVHSFWQAIQDETLRRLNILDCVMGSELLESTARDLLFPRQLPHLDRMAKQPYYIPTKGHPGTAFFATATHLNRRATVLLGRDFPDYVSAPERYNFLEACLASSAFPVVFAPRSVSDLFPGLGRTDTLLSDGGIFDNLPFFPAIEVMADVQADYAKEYPDTSFANLRQRHRRPALMIAAGLDCNPDRGSLPHDIIGLRKYASTLSNNVKIESFEKSSERVYRMTELLIAGFENRQDLNRDFADSIVTGAVLKILPGDQDHLNGTFEFCRSTGLDPGKMRRSIAHGCFQTLQALASRPDQEKRPALHAALTSCRRGGRLAEIQASPRPLPAAAALANGPCPFFTVRGKRPVCPFHASKDPDAMGIHKACVKDGLHRKSSA